MPRTVLMAGVAVGTLVLACPASQAQVWTGVAGENENVTVDLSVLNGGGRTAMPGIAVPGGVATGDLPPTYRPGLLVPGPEAPVSRLLVMPSSGAATLPPSEKLAEPRVVLHPPKAEPAQTAAAPAEAPMAPSVPAAAAPPPEPKVAARPVPKPTESPAAAPATPRVPPPPPAPPVTASAPKPVAPAPKPAASAPPPPPVAVPEPAKTVAPEPKPAQTAAAKPASVSVPPPPPVSKPPEAIPSAAPPPTPEKQTASLTSGGPVEPGLVAKVVFADEASKLPDSAKKVLSDLVQRIGETSELRVQLLAYAGGEALSSSKARRLSLSRALSVRSFLIESGMRSTRIDVRALGNKTEEEPLNRVDVNVVER